MFSGREEDFYMWAKRVENYVSGVFPNVRGALLFAVESQDAVTATAVALGVPELEAEMPTEIDGQLFIVLSAVTDGESFDVVMSAGGDHGFESWRTLHRRWDPCTAGRARSLLREILSPSRVMLPELMGAIERMEDLVRRYCGRRDAACETVLAPGFEVLHMVDAVHEYAMQQFAESRDDRVIGHGHGDEAAGEKVWRLSESARGSFGSTSSFEVSSFFQDIVTVHGLVDSYKV